MPRLAHVAATFAIVLMAYWAYAVVAVPLIEPAAEPIARRVGPDPRPSESAKTLRRWEALFPPGAWELKDPKVLTMDQVQLVFQEYQNLGHGRVRIHPFTIIFTPDNAEEAADTEARTIVLEAPDGAVCRFDGAFDPSKFKMGQFLGGELPGTVTIRSRGKSPDGQDSLLVTTRNVHMDKLDVTTSEAVDFRFGPHFGRGRQMHMRMMPSQGGHTNQAGTNIGGLEYFEVRSVERLHLDRSKPKAATPPKPAPGGPPAPSATAAAARGPTGLDPAGMAGMPLEITCRGPFRFNVVQQRATFEDQVEVLQVHPTPPNDRLTCNLLIVSFTKRAGRSGPFDLEPQRIEANGTPAVLVAPAENVYAAGQQMQYDLQGKWISLSDGREVVLRRGGDEIHARSVRYESAEPGRLGRVEAQGPGWLRRQMAERADQQLEARWGDRLRVQPQQGEQVISLTGGAELRFQAINQLRADEIHFWLLESPQPPPRQSKLQPDRMLARGRVKLDSPQFSAVVDQLETWFKPAPAAAVPAASPLPAAGAAPARPGENVAARQTGGAPPPRQQHMEITGRLMRAEVLLSADGKKADLSALTVEDNVRLVETKTALAGQQPLLLTGDWLKIRDANGPDGTVRVLGRPAHFEGRGLSLTGSNLNLDRGDNHFWIDGPGRMERLVDRDLERRPLEKPVNLQVDWQHKMDFDGRKAVFRHAVVASDPTHRLRTEVMEAQLQQPIRFADAKMDKTDGQIEEIYCHGGVFMESYSLDDRGQQLSQQRMEVPWMRVNAISGALLAGGPGWVVSVRRGAADLLASAAGTGAGAPPGAAPAVGTAHGKTAAKPPSDQLGCVHVRFQGGITGDIRHEATFHDQVRAAYAPVDSWTASLDTENVEALGPNGALLHCDELSADNLAAPASKTPGLEFVAAGNAVLEGGGDQFTARAARITYDQKKDLMILEGDGRTDAELYRQLAPGARASKAAARKIFYWPKTKRSYVDGARTLEFNQSPGDRSSNNRKSLPLPGTPGISGR
ncbi:MAG: hypothetical protein ACLQLG_03660 [Thermoguttaceae bacterium]